MAKQPDPQTSTDRLRRGRPVKAEPGPGAGRPVKPDSATGAGRALKPDSPTGAGRALRPDSATGSGRALRPDSPTGSGRALRPDSPTGSGRALRPDSPTGTGRAPSGASTSKVVKPQEPTKSEIVAKATARTARGLKSVLLWLVPIAAAVAGLYFMFKPRDVPVQMTSPDGALRTYTRWVEPYVPPSGLMPSQANVNEWLEFFDDKSRMWFNDNARALSYFKYQNNPDEWKKITPDRQRMEAMQYMLTQGPLKGAGSISNIKIDEKAGSATAEVRSGPSVAQVTLTKIGKRWIIKDFMDQSQDLGARAQALRLPG